MPTWKKLAYELDVITKALLTEQGDVIYASAASTPAALAHGTATQYLKSGGHGANPSWDTPAGAGATLTVAETQAFTGNAPQATWTDLDLHLIVGSNYALVLLKVTNGVAAARPVYFRMNGDTEPTIIAPTTGVCGMVMPASSVQYLLCLTDSGGIVEWSGGSTAGQTTTIDVVAYIK